MYTKKNLYTIVSIHDHTQVNTSSSLCNTHTPQQIYPSTKHAPTLQCIDTRTYTTPTSPPRLFPPQKKTFAETSRRRQRVDQVLHTDTHHTSHTRSDLGRIPDFKKTKCQNLVVCVHIHACIVFTLRADTNTRKHVHSLRVHFE